MKLNEGVELRVRPLRGDCLPTVAAAVRDRAVDPALTNTAPFQVAGVPVELPVRRVSVALGREQTGPVRPGHAAAKEKNVGFFPGLQDAQLVIDRREVGDEPFRVRLRTAFRWR